MRFIFIAALFSACAELPVEEQASDTAAMEALPMDQAPTSIAAPLFTFARGMACGVSYDDGSSTYSYDCMNSYPMTKSPGWTGVVNGQSVVKRDLGDWGRSAGQGFEAYEITSGATSGSSTSSAERGTVCGFGHTRNMTSPRCYLNSVLLNHSPGSAPQLSCPSGWTGRSFSDASSGGHYWFWCERSSQPGIAATSPEGVACGMFGTGAASAWCGTRNVVTSGCDSANYDTIRFKDWGRSAGQGLSVCVHR